MLVTGQPPVRRRGRNRRGRNNRTARIAVPVTAAAAVSLGGGLLVASGGGPAQGHAAVSIDIGFNGEILRQVGATPGALRQGNCTDGEPGSPFGQVSFCNGPNFFKAAFALERSGRLVIPSVGISRKMVVTGGALG